MVTSSQIARVFWRGRSQSRDLCNRRLRILYDLHCVDRFFPYTLKGSSQQHLVLDYSGAKILGLENFNKRKELPYTYKHMILVTEFRVIAYKKWKVWGELEKKIGNIKSDIFYKKYNIAVEIDTGSENYSILDKKSKKYNRSAVEGVIFVTDSGNRRVDRFLNNINRIRKAGCIYDNLDIFISKFSKKLN